MRQRCAVCPHSLIANFMWPFSTNRTDRPPRQSAPPSPWRRLLNVVIVGLAIPGALYVVFAIGTVLYISLGGEEIKSICTPALEGRSRANIEAALDKTKFSIIQGTDYLYLTRASTTSGHRCHIAFNEHGISSEVKVIFHF